MSGPDDHLGASSAVGRPAGRVPVTRGQLEAMAGALCRGEVVVLPTDTVYGLAARLGHPGALAAVFELKERPPGLALPVLVDDIGQVGEVAAAWPAAAAVLAGRYWPGPLTLVVPARPEIAGSLGGDGTSVGVRCPDHDVVRSLCRIVGPLAVTSANRHGRQPCTTAAAAASAFPGILVVDGGTCEGVPSTVVDCTASPPRSLREGALAWSELAAVLA